MLAQTYTDWELWAIDDFSTDTSAEVLAAFAKKDKRIRVLANTDKGIIPALRLAFAKSEGLLVTRMDADDKMPPRKLELMQKALAEAGLGHLVTGLVQYFSRKGIQDGYRRYEAWLNQLVLEDRHYEEIYRECVIPSPAWMLYREDLLRCGAFEPEQYPEDYDLVFRFYENEMKVVPIPELLHYWRDHEERSSRTMEQYANSSYFALKVPYFLKLDRDLGRPLVLWGAGRKGKQVAKMLQVAGAAFHWVCDTPSKIGLDIYGVTMQHYDLIRTLDHPQVIVVVSNPEEQASIAHSLQGRPGIDYYFFV